MKDFLYNHPCFSFAFHQGYSQSKKKTHESMGFMALQISFKNREVMYWKSSSALWYKKIKWWFFMKTGIVLWALGKYFMVTSGFISNRNMWRYVRTWYKILSRLQDVESNTWVNKFPLLAIYVVLKMKNCLQSFSWELWTPLRFNSAVISLFSLTWP